MSASPASPGATPELYQATFAGTDGVPIRPCASSPTDSTLVFTPIAGIRRRVGGAARATMARAFASMSSVGLGLGAAATFALGRHAATLTPREGANARPANRTPDTVSTHPTTRTP